MKTLASIILISLIYVLFEFGFNLPQTIGLDVPEGKLNSLSFAPYREGQSPLNKTFPSEQELESDLQLMAQKTKNIRTYASAEGVMPLIPALVRKYGLTLLQGAWLDADKQLNKIEIDELIRSANTHPDVIKRVMVGNEVLLRGSLEPEELIEYIREVKRSVKQPVSYADVWSMYMKHPQLIKEVDFVTIHILPYWEDEPISVDEAPAHIERIYQQVQKEAYAIAPNIPILIGESGWPSEGRQRGYAQPGVVNEAKFIRGFIKVAHDNGFDYNIVEAFNQSWKSALEGVVGASWGMYSVDRKEVFPLTGDVYEHSNWLKNTLIAIGLFLVVTGFCWKKLHALPFLHQLGGLIFIQVVSILLVKQLAFHWYTSYSDWQRLGTLIQVALNIALSFLTLNYGLRKLSGQSINIQWSNWLYFLFVTLATLATFRTFELAINGRYISFPSISVGVAIACLVALVLIQYAIASESSTVRIDIATLTEASRSNSQWNKRLAYALPISIFLLLLGETIDFVIARDLVAAYPGFWERLGISMLFTVKNSQLITWIACLSVLTIPFWNRIRLRYFP